MKSSPLIAFTLSLLTAPPCVAQLSTGATNPGTATVVTLPGASFTRNNPNGALAAGGSAATTANLLSVNTGTTNALGLTNFGFNLPTGSDNGQYSYFDETAPEQGTVYYRLMLHEAAGPDTWSTVQALADKPGQLVIKMFPNPFHNMINIPAPGAAFTHVILRNAQGANIWVKD